jgi:hypothetical protein
MSDGWTILLIAEAIGVAFILLILILAWRRR